MGRQCKKRCHINEKANRKELRYIEYVGRVLQSRRDSNEPNAPQSATNRGSLNVSSTRRKMVGLRGQSETTERPQKIKDVIKDEQSIESALEIFVEAKEAENVRPRTIAEYRNHIRYLIDFFREERDVVKTNLSLLTSENVVAYINYLTKDKVRYKHDVGRRDKTIGLSPATINIRLRTLRTMCNFWYGAGMIKVNPMETIKQLRYDEDDAVPGLTDDELKRLLDSYDEKQYADWRDKILCLLMLDTGLRPTEAVELPIEDIDFKTHTVLVRSSAAKNRRMRTVPMSQEIARLLRSLIVETSDYFGDIDHVFISSYGEALSSDSFRKRLNRRKGRLGMERLSPNQFRHTFCRNYILSGGDIFTLQKIVGHRDIHTTRKYVQMDYSHLESQHELHSPATRIMKRL